MNDKIRDLKIRLMLEAEKELTEDLTEAQRYQYYLGRMQFLHYVSGKENLRGFLPGDNTYFFINKNYSVEGFPLLT